MALLIYFLSLVFALLVVRMKRLPIFSPLPFFLFFCMLYSIFPYLAYLGMHPPNIWLLPLLERKDLLDIHFVNVALSIFGFSIFHAYVIRNTYRKPRNEAYQIDSTRKRLTNSEYIILFSFFAVAMLCLVLGYFYPWGGWGGELGRPDLINSILGNSKIFLAVVLAYFFCRRGFGYFTVLLLLCLLLITFIEGSRTTLITVLIAMIIVAASNGALSAKRLLALMALSAAGFYLMTLIAFIRIGLPVDKLTPFEALYPLYFEGMYGSYMCLQIYDLIWVRGVMEPTWGAHMVIDPLVFLMPRGLLTLIGVSKDTVTVYAIWEAKANSLLDDMLGPYGGFFYIADAFLALPYLGPLFVSAAFGLVTGYFEKLGAKGFRGRYVYMLYLIGAFVVFIKHQISQSTHFLLVTAIVGFAIYLATGRFKSVSKRPSRKLIPISPNAG